MAKKNNNNIRSTKPKGQIGDSKKDIDTLRKAMEIPPKTSSGSGEGNSKK